MTSGVRTRCVFRVAAGPRLGFGHLLRARALARQMGIRPIVSMRGNAAARATARSLGCRLVQQSALLADADVLVVDDPSARHGAVWLRRARAAGVASVAVNDVGVGGKGADLMVDGSITTALRGTRALAGPSFCILDPAVARARLARRRGRAGRQQTVLVSLGGGRQIRRHAVRIVAAIERRCPGVSIQVAAGMSARRLPALPHGRWIVRRQGLSRDLAAADVVVVGGGVTLYEACAIGAPVVATAVVAAQRAAIRTFVRLGAALDGGEVGRRPADSAARVGAAVAALLGDPSRRRRLTAVARRLVDGRGAGRVAGCIAALAGHNGRQARCV